MFGEGVPSEWVGRRVWCYGAQSYRPFGTAAEFTVVPLDHVAPLPDSVSAQEGACLGIPGITAHRAVHVGGELTGRTVLVQGAGGAVGMCAVALARHAGARVIGTVRSSSEEPAARGAGAHEVVLNDQGVVAGVKALAPAGVDHRRCRHAEDGRFDRRLRHGRRDAEDPVLADGLQKHPPVLPGE